MQLFRRTLLIATLFVASVSSLRAQPAADPSGHWQGMLQAPGMDVEFEVDLAKNAGGDLSGTVSISAQRPKGVPLLEVGLDGSTLTFYARADQPPPAVRFPRRH